MLSSSLNRKLLQTILAYSLAAVLKNCISKKKKSACNGCKRDHPSQNEHECIMLTELEHLDRHFDQVYGEFSLVDVLLDFKERVKMVNICPNFVCNFFLLNAIMLDKLHTKLYRDTVYGLLKKNINESSV